MWYNIYSTLDRAVVFILTSAERQQAEAFLGKIRPLLCTGEFTIARTEKNIAFDREFSLTHQEKCAILLTLTADDCCQIAMNNNPRYETDEVYIFFKETVLPVFGEPENVKLYLKMYIREARTYDIVIVISFHKEGMHDL